MTEVTVQGKLLIVDIEGWDKLWSFKSRIEIPIKHVVGVHAAPNEHAKGIRAPGTGLPGIVVAGTFYTGEGRVFWDVHDSRRAIAIELRDDDYARLVIEVADPGATMAQILNAINASKG